MAISLGALDVCAADQNPQFILLKNGDIYVAQDMNAAPVALTNYQNELRHTEFLGLSSDGTRLFISINSDAETEEMKLAPELWDVVPEREVWMIKTNGSGEKQLVLTQNFGENFPSPDGELVATVECDDASCSGLSITRTVDGVADVSIGRSDIQTYASDLCAWTPDGSRVYFLDNVRLRHKLEDPDPAGNFESAVDFHTICYWDKQGKETQVLDDYQWPNGTSSDGRVQAMQVTGDGLLLALAQKGKRDARGEASVETDVLYIYDPQTQSKRIVEYPAKFHDSWLGLVPALNPKSVYILGVRDQIKGLMIAHLPHGEVEGWIPLDKNFWPNASYGFEWKAPRIHPFESDGELWLAYETASQIADNGYDPIEAKILLHNLTTGESKHAFEGFRLGTVADGLL